MASRIDMLNRLGVMHLTESNAPHGHTPLVFHAYLVGAPVVVAGYGGWSRVARPRRKALTEWVGRDSISIECQFLVDGFEDQQGLWVEANCRSLESIAGVDIQDPEPPLCILTSDPAGLMPHGYARASHVRWFVDTLQWDRDSVIYSTNGNRQRAGGTLTVTQYVSDERLTVAALRRKKKGQTKGGRRRTYTVRRGDTLEKIAARKDTYHDPKKWRLIKNANNIRDPKHLKVGRKLKIP